MIKEFAVDPEALKTWADLRYVSEKFGIEQGRFISRFPKRWPELVEKNIEETSWRHRQQFIAKLTDLKRGRKGALLSRSRSYENRDPWKTNACRSHRESPFHAIFAEEPWPEEPCAIAVADAAETDFEAPRDMAVVRTAHALAEAVAPLLSLSREVFFLDPYFRPDQRRWRNPLREILDSVARPGATLRRCEFHLKKYEHLLEDFRDFRDECLKKLPGVVPQGFELKLIRWQQIGDDGPDPGEHFHARFILTDIGGIWVDSGLDEGEGQETTKLGLLSDELCRTVRDSILGDSPAFAPADVDSNGNHMAVTVEGRANQ